MYTLYGRNTVHKRSKNDLLQIHFKSRVYFLLLLQSYFVVLLLCLLYTLINYLQNISKSLY